MKNNLNLLVSLVVGFALIIVSIIYFLQPANKLPHFFPGHDASLIKHHLKHAIGSLGLGVLAFIFAWFTSGKKSSQEE